MCSSVELDRQQAGEWINKRLHTSTPAQARQPGLSCNAVTYGNSFACASSWQLTELGPERYVHTNMDCVSSYLASYLPACPLLGAWQQMA